MCGQSNTLAISARQVGTTGAEKSLVCNRFDIIQFRELGAFHCGAFFGQQSLSTGRRFDGPAPLGNLSGPNSFDWHCCEANDMAKLALIYGMRLLPEEDLGEVKDATVVLKNGRTARITMHLIEGSKEEIEATFHQSVEAFFEMYPEI